MKTTSVEPSRVSGFGPKSNGAGRIYSASVVWIRIGPNEPIRSHSEAEPGPPL